MVSYLLLFICFLSDDQLWLKWMAANLSKLSLLVIVFFWIFSELVMMLRLDSVIAWLSLSSLDVRPDLFLRV